MNSTLQLLQNSITSFDILRLKYKNANSAISEREIEPLALFFEQGEWKLIAFCKMRKENRTFLIKRIYLLERIEQNFPPNQFNLEDYFRSKKY